MPVPGRELVVAGLLREKTMLAAEERRLTRITGPDCPETFLFQIRNRGVGDSDVFDMSFFQLARGWHPT